MYFSSLLLSLWLVQRVTAESFYGGYSQSTEYCAVVNIGNDKSNPGIECQCLFSGEYVACSVGFGNFLVNDMGRLKYGPKGAASRSCIGWSLFGTTLAANCSGPAITMVDLDKLCGTSNGNLLCGEQQDSSGSTATSLAAPSSTSVMDSTPASTFTTSLTPPSTSAVASDQASSVAQTSTSDPSVDNSQTSAPAATGTVPSATASADTTDACGNIQKRMRIMSR